MSSDEIMQQIATVMRMREQNGGHLHHRDCIHNLPPEQQIQLRGKTLEWWVQVIGPLPEQITPADWQIESPFNPPAQEETQ